MTFQEAYTNHKRLVFHGHEKGYWLFSFDDDPEVYRFPNSEVESVMSQFKTPEQREQERRHEETTLMVNAEMTDRLSACNLARWAGIIMSAIFTFMVSHCLSAGKPSALWFFIPALCIILFLYHKNEKEREVIIKFFKWRKEQEEEWG